MTLDNILDYGIKLALLVFENQIRLVYSLYRTVCRNFDNIQLVNLAKLLFLCHSCTCHTGKLFVQAEIVLESNGCKGFAFVCNLNTLFSLYSLVQALVISTAVHKSAGKFINDYYLAVFYDIVNITAHCTVCLYCLVYMVLNSQVIRVCKVVNIKESLCFFYACLCKRSCFCFFVNNIVNTL